MSEEAEEAEFQKAKRTLQFINVLAGIMPSNFNGVFEEMITPLRHEDKDIGELLYFSEHYKCIMCSVCHSEADTSNTDINWRIY